MTATPHPVDPAFEELRERIAHSSRKLDQLSTRLDNATAQLDGHEHQKATK